MKNVTALERKSERELVITRTFNGPVSMVFDAWTKPELLKKWWTPKGYGIEFLSCEIDPRTGGRYKFVFSSPQFPKPMEFFGKYLEVIPNKKLVWTNEEGIEGGEVTTVTFEEIDGKTRVVMHELFATKEALETDGTGAAEGMKVTFEQLEEMLAASA
ncbi:MAG: SRPBCC domain-containing protein [Deltaproteobacteria bacterium]|nr:SRPBCC domain-containing protein [Deltaproteobacteria bacterium]